MSMCPNCNKNLGCSCQKRKASDGTQVCTNCVTSYENQLRDVKNNTTIKTQPIENQDVITNKNS